MRFDGHVSWFRDRVVIYGFNAMHVAVNVKAFGWWWCFHPPMRCFGHWWPWYAYASRDATPCDRGDGNVLFGFGPGFGG